MTSKDKPSQPGDKYVIRFPDGMRDKIAEAARANGRSMNAEIVQRLDASLERITPGFASTLPGAPEGEMDATRQELATVKRLSIASEGLALLLADRLRAVIEGLPEKLAEQRHIAVAKRFVDGFFDREPIGMLEGIREMFDGHAEVVRALDEFGAELGERPAQDRRSGAEHEESTGGRPEAPVPRDKRK